MPYKLAKFHAYRSHTNDLLHLNLSGNATDEGWAKCVTLLHEAQEEMANLISGLTDLCLIDYLDLNDYPKVWQEKRIADFKRSIYTAKPSDLCRYASFLFGVHS